MVRLLDPSTTVRLDEIVTVVEAARRAGIHPSVMAYYIRRDDVPAFRVGPNWCLREPDVANFLSWHGGDLDTGSPRLATAERRGTPGRRGRARAGAGHAG